MQKDIAVIGLGVFGFELALQLQKQGRNVLAVDINPEEINHIRDQVTGAVVASVTDQEALQELGLDKFEMVVLGLGGNFEELVLGVTYLKKLGIEHVIARANTEIQQEILLKIGADEVILPEKQSAQRLAERIARPDITEMLELDETVKLAEVHLRPKFDGKTIRQLDLRRKYNITAILLKRNGQKPKIITDPELMLRQDDYLVVLGSQEDIERTFA